MSHAAESTLLVDDRQILTCRGHEEIDAAAYFICVYIDEHCLMITFGIWVIAFLAAPCRPATPQHKGKVEQGGVHYVKRNFLGGREATSLTQANRDVLVWCETTAGLRTHGTIKAQPLSIFNKTEQSRLQALPDAPYDLAVWKVLPRDDTWFFLWLSCAWPEYGPQESRSHRYSQFQ